MKKKISLLLALCLLLSVFALTACTDSEEPDPDPTGKVDASPSPSDDPEVSDDPVTSSGAELGETADAGQSYIDKLIFIGDSTTYGLKAYSMLSGGKDTWQVWTPTSGTLALFNQSWATILYPKTGEEIPITDAVALEQPEYIVLTIGANGVAMMDEEQFKADYTDLVNRILSVSPDTIVICNSIYPVEASYEAKGNGINNAKIDAANVWVKEVAEATGTYYLNTASVLKGADGCLVPEYGNGDGIHLCTTGFERVLNYIRTHACV